jgi:hypothetical protein
MNGASAGAATAAAGAKGSIVTARISGVLKARTGNCTAQSTFWVLGPALCARPETTGAPF